MRTFGSESVTYLYVNGLATDTALRLTDQLELLPAKPDCHLDLFLGLGKSDIDISVISLFLPRVASQFKVTGSSSKDIAIRSWNAVWDGLLLGALTGTDVMCNLQSETPVEELTPESLVAVTNYHLRGLSQGEAKPLSKSTVSWVEKHYEQARSLLDEESFQNAVHCLASYHWHSMPRAKLAVLWSGIEGLFDVDSELVFRISLYAAKFLAPNDLEKQKEIFARVKTLYKARSKAVHGGRIKTNAKQAVEESAELLRMLVVKCAEVGAIPDAEVLVL